MTEYQFYHSIAFLNRFNHLPISAVFCEAAFLTVKNLLIVVAVVVRVVAVVVETALTVAISTANALARLKFGQIAVRKALCGR